MKPLRLLAVLLIMLMPLKGRAQSLFEPEALESSEGIAINGFVRALQYITADDQDHILFPTTISDLGLKLDVGNALTYRAYADIRYRFGNLNGKAIREFRIPEAWVSVYSPGAALRVGQQVLKWGSAEFINSLDVFNPRNDLVRSPDIEDRNLGNLLAVIDLYPSQKFYIQFAGSPVRRSSYLYTDYIEADKSTFFTDNEPPGKSKFSYGARLGFAGRGFETRLYWFDGYYPMPGLSLDSLYIPASEDEEFRIQIGKTPYRRKIAGIDMEFALNRLIIRTGLSYSSSPLSRQENDYIPFPQANWFGNIEFKPGSFTIITEYSGSKVLEFTEPPAEAVLPGSGGFASLPPMTPAEMTGYAGQLISSFNRLMNYQAEEYYHSAGVLISYTNRAMTLMPELRILYNFTSAEVMLQPVLSYNASDNIKFSFGIEYWQGEANSIFQLIHKGLNGINAGLQINF